jgi:hypothetical protein
MLQTILHMLGLCPDHFNHINLLDMPWQDILNFFNQVKAYFRK